MTTLNILLLTLATVTVAGVHAFIYELFNLDKRDWLFGSIVGSSFLAGIVLVFLYHRLSRLSARFSALMLWGFFGYAYLQAWYPYLFAPGHNQAAFGVLYIAALVLKLACTILVFLARIPPPEKLAP